MQSNLLHIFFDVETGNDYPDGDEWFIAEFLFPYQMNLPDNLKGTELFYNHFCRRRKKVFGIIVN